MYLALLLGGTQQLVMDFFLVWSMVHSLVGLRLPEWPNGRESAVILILILSDHLIIR